MATTYGVTASGFRRKTVDEIITDVEAAQLSTMYDDLDVSAESVVGQMNGIFGAELGSGWEALEQLYNAGDVDAAEDRSLENLCKLAGVYRVGLTKGTVTLTCDLVAGTKLVSGTHFAEVKDQPDIRWTPSADYTALTTGAQPVVFRAELGGPISAASGSITVISTPIVGWNGVSQPDDADAGDVTETNQQLRARRERELAKAGSATLPAIRSKISTALSAAGQSGFSVAVYENTGDVTDGYGRPPHSVEVLVFDGNPPPAGNAAIIAQAIVDAGIGGIQTYGGVSALASVLDGTQTVTRAINFSRVTVIPMTVQISVIKGVGYPGDAALAAYIVDQANAYHGTGDDVAWSYLTSLTFRLGGVVRVTGILLNLNPSADFSIGLREIARFSVDQMLISSS